MRIKHYAGYGFVNAVVVKKRCFKDCFNDSYKEVVVRVTGEHEWGLERNDLYDAFKWLLRRFDKCVKSYDQVNSFEVRSEYEKQSDGSYMEVCNYRFVYRIEK